MTIESQLPPANVRLVDVNGYISVPYRRFFESVWGRTGGYNDQIYSITINNATGDATLAELSASAEGLAQQIESIRSQLDANVSADFASEIERLSNDLQSVRGSIDAIIANDNYSALAEIVSQMQLASSNNISDEIRQELQNVASDIATLFAQLGAVRGDTSDVEAIISGAVTLLKLTVSGTITGANIIGTQLVVRGGATEGGQLVLGYVGTTSITGQANSTWNVDVNASNDFRVFRQGSAGSTIVPISIAETTGVVTFSATPVGVTPTTGDASTKLATTAFVQSDINYLIAYSARQYGVKADGVTDDTSAWNTALAAGKTLIFPEGTSVITDKLIFGAVEGQRIIGVGSRKSKFSISHATFNMAATSVIEQTSAFQGLVDVGFEFVQPSTSVRANLKAYPWVFDGTASSRPLLRNVYVQNGYNGIIANGGGAIFENIEMGTFNEALYLDGALDSCYIKTFRVWPYGFAGDANLMSIYNDGSTVGGRFGRIDDLNIQGYIPYNCKVYFQTGASGFASFGNINGLSMDATKSALIFSDGDMSISSFYSTSGADYKKIQMSGGKLKINGAKLDSNVNGPTSPFCEVTGGNFILSNFTANYIPRDAEFIKQSAGSMIVSNGKVTLTPNAARTIECIGVTGGRATVKDVEFTDAGTGTGDAIKIHNDEAHVVTGNKFEGWGYSLPTVYNYGVYGPNIQAFDQFINNHYFEAVYIKKLTGTITADPMTIAHGIPNGHTKILSVMAARNTGVGTSRSPIPWANMDGTNIQLTGYTTGDYEIVIKYTT